MYLEKYSTDSITAAFSLASGHPGLEIKICTTVLYAVLVHNRVHKSITACRGCTSVTVYTRHVNSPYVVGHVSPR